MTSLTVERRSGGLPAPVTGFVGRERDLDEVRAAVERSRLVTLCGPGGVGKTRLALHVAAGLRPDFPDGVCLVELSALRDPALLARTAAEALRLPDPGPGDPLDPLAGYLADKRLLLVLDTCEHLVDACAMLAEVLVRAAPRVRILATSREPLDVIGEHTVPVGPMPVPDADDSPGVHDAVELFAERAAAVRPGFVLTDADRPLAHRLVRRLDGIPLAIELAAVRLRMMSLEQLLDRLDDRFRLLGTARGSQYRHQTLRAAVEWSHDLCTGPERLLWARLSVFPGDFDLDAAEAVCAGDGLPAADLLDVLGRLVDKSVVRFDEEARRYRMLDTLREFGAEHLPDGDRRAALDRHLAHFTALAERLDAELTGPGQLAWSVRLRREQANLRVALEWALTTPGRAEAGLRLAVLLGGPWHHTALFGEARDWYRRALAAAPGDGPDQAWALYWQALFAVQQGDLAEAAPLLDGSLGLADRLGDEELRAHVLSLRGLSAFYTDDLDTAVALYEESAEIFERVGYTTLASRNVLVIWAAAHAMRGELERALELAAETVRRADGTGERWIRSYGVWMRGGARWLSGDTAGAAADLRDSLRVMAEFDDLAGIAMCLDVLLVCAATDGDHGRTAVLRGAADGLWELLRAPVRRGARYSALLDAACDTARRELGAGRAAALHARGRALPLAEAVALGLSDGREPADVAPDPVLSPREAEVAALVAEGLTNREIAERLVISKRTVDSHVEHILAKLGLASRTQVAGWAARGTSQEGKDIRHPQ